MRGLRAFWGQQTATHFCNSQRLMACAAATLIKFQPTHARMHSPILSRSVRPKINKIRQKSMLQILQNFTTTLAENEREKNISAAGRRIYWLLFRAT
jgi:hypothetical protein